MGISHWSFQTTNYTFWIPSSATLSPIHSHSSTLTDPKLLPMETAVFSEQRSNAMPIEIIATLNFTEKLGKTFEY